MTIHAKGDPVRLLAVQGHRGASALAPENTLAAFQKAIELGADGMEMDLQLTRDGAVVVIHDDTLDRTTDGHGRVADLSLAGSMRDLNENGLGINGLDCSADFSIVEPDWFTRFQLIENLRQGQGDRGRRE